MNTLAAGHEGYNIFNCGTGKSVSFNRLVELINSALGLQRQVEFIDNPKPHLYQSHTECAMEKART
ncbi:hypothetical protein ABTF26_21850, partial [Acinetobacter baumannii]